MAIIKCKMCGGDIELSADKTFGTCESCGSLMTFPKVDDEQRANMFNRGNHFRRTGEFDKALAVYERIVQEDENDAEAHWCCALCRFGIEYVEDPNTFEYLPTCHRASFDSFLEDVDYLAAIEHSEGVTRRQYQKDAAKIAEVQRGILATSQNEEPFDVFICYKESEDDGSRTRDSLFAQEIYYQLTEQGRRVFFSRITLEDKAGTEYEPYIFAALNSAKVMILVTTSAEHANAVWVKNEWSRFLSLMRKDRTKLLLPCYRGMDPYDLPEALSVLQSYDMSKIGFIQDLTRGVNKVLNANKPKEPVRETVVVQQTQANVAPLLKRVRLFLEDGSWEAANEYAEKVLDVDPENAEAYLGKLMAELHVRTQNGLKDVAQPFDDRINCRKVARFGTEEQKQFLMQTNADIRARNEEEEKRLKLENAKKTYEHAERLIAQNTLSSMRQAQEVFGRIRWYEDAEAREQACEQTADRMEIEETYQRAVQLETVQTIESLEKAVELYNQIPDYQDVPERRDAAIALMNRKKKRQRLWEAYQNELKQYGDPDELKITKNRLLAEKAKLERPKRKAWKILGIVVCCALFVLMGLGLIINAVSKTEINPATYIWFVIITIALISNIIGLQPPRQNRSRLMEINASLGRIDGSLEHLEQISTFEKWLSQNQQTI